MKKYLSNREKIVDFFENKVIPILKNKELEYYELVSALRVELGVSESMIEDVINQLKNVRKLKEVRYLAPSDEKLIEFLKELREREKETKKIDEEMKKIEQQAKESQAKQILPSTPSPLSTLSTPSTPSLTNQTKQSETHTQQEEVK